MLITQREAMANTAMELVKPAVLVVCFAPQVRMLVVWRTENGGIYKKDDGHGGGAGGAVEPQAKKPAMSYI
jgi:hypothetical protein